MNDGALRNEECKGKKFTQESIRLLGLLFTRLQKKKSKGKIVQPANMPEYKKNYNSKKEDNKEKDQREDERNVIL